MSFGIALLLRTRRIQVGKKPWILGIPRIKKHPDASIRIGDGVRLFSASFANPLMPSSKSCIHAMEEHAVIRIGSGAGISSSTIVAKKNISIGERTIIGAGCLIVDNDFHSLDHGKRFSHDDIPEAVPVKIGDDCFIGARSIILKGVSIGNRTVVGAGSVVSRSLPADCVACGNPAKVVRVKLAIEEYFS
jgi:acetyltransferase-like isoleucine patch superfamily enzyme